MRKVLKWLGIVVGGLIGLLLLAFVVIVILGTLKINKTYTVAVTAVCIPTGLPGRATLVRVSGIRHLPVHA